MTISNRQSSPDDAESSVEHTVLAIVREVLGRPGLTADQDFFDVGATSLAFVRVLAEVHRQMGVMVHPADLTEASARALAGHVTASASRSTVASRGA
ncbi:MAG: acyl carrier protein [Actinobacteria bacterium]|nr:acyl carrier protein [Actinomycetota bacterium]